MSNTNQIIRNLNTLKEKIKDASDKRTRAEALRDQALERIKELGYKDVGGAVAALKEMQSDVTKAEAELEDMVNKLQEDFPEL